MNRNINTCMVSTNCVQKYKHTRCSNPCEFMPNKHDQCPKCPNLKDTRAKHCTECRKLEWIEKRKWRKKKICKCGKIMDIRAEQCQECRNSYTSELQRIKTICKCGNKKGIDSIMCRACRREADNPIKDSMITCTTCSDLKHYEEFPLVTGARTKRRTVCKECSSTLATKYHIYRKCRSLGLPSSFALELIHKKSADCEICGKATEQFHIDHCHKENTYRGLLCSHCNSGLGFFTDNQEHLQKAIEYLNAHQLKQADSDNTTLRRNIS